MGSSLAVLFVSLFTISIAGNHRYSGIKLKVRPAPVRTREDVCREAQVELSVWCQLDSRTSRRLQISWWVPHVEPDDVIALYVTDPDVNQTAPVFTLSPMTDTGWSHTPLSETYLDHSHIFYPVCLGYWVVYWRRHLKVASSCLQTNPSWMSDHRDQLGRLRLTDLFLPGTHDSAAYSVSYQPRDLPRYDKYVFTQEESVLSQLIHGIRFLDLRLGYHKEQGVGKFYAHHGFVKLRNFQGVIDDIITFLKNSKDIVVIDLHHFPVGFKNVKVHMELIKYLEEELLEYMANPALTWQATLEDVWRNGKQLVVSYNYPAIVARHTHKLWPAVAQLWGDVRSPIALREHLEATIKSKNGRTAWAAMAELTPDTLSVLLDSVNGLRGMAAKVNNNVTHWFRKDWGLDCHIVAVDFFRSTGIINAAIDWNLRKAFNLCL